MRSTYFVTGTDTDVGKTFITLSLMARAKSQGLKTYALKPLAAGADISGGNSDALALQAMANIELSYEQVNPVLLELACAPHIAAAKEGRRVTLNRLEGFCRGALMQKADIRFIEGAGGWRVPLGDGNTLADLPKRLNLPIILVVGLRLGCLNHAALSAEAIANDGLRLAGWVANTIDPHMPHLAENVDALRRMLPGKCLGEIPYAGELASISDAVLKSISIDSLC